MPRPLVGRSTNARKLASSAALLLLAAVLAGFLAVVPASTPPSAWASPNSAGVQALTGIPSNSFWLADAQGGVWNFGRAASFGSAASVPLNHPIVGITPTVDAQGYW